MSTAFATATAAPPPAMLGSVTEAEALVRHLDQIMDALLELVAEETALVRAGKLTEAGGLEHRKSELSTLYVADAGRIRASQPFLDRAAPDLANRLRERHSEFRAVLQMNLTVLATAHAVSESIIRGVSTELQRKATPQAYGASGHATTPGAAARLPLTLSRVL